MASIADMLVGQGLQESGKSVDIAGSVQKGAALAQTIQNMEAQRQDIEQKKTEIQITKANKIMEAIEKGNNFKDKAAQNLYFKKHVPSMVKAMGMENFFGPDLMEYVQGSQDVRNKLVGLKLDIQDKINMGELRGAEILNYAKNKLTPEELPLLDTDQLLEQQKFAASEEGKSYRSKMMMQGQAQRQQEQIESAGPQQLAKDVAKEFSDYQAGGGKAGVEKNLKRLEDAAKKLESGKVQTGKLTAAVPFLGADAAQDVLNPDVSAVRDDVRGAIQSTLKQTLGAQFTEKEAEAIFNRSFNPRQSAAENARRIRAEIQGLRQSIANKEAAFESQGFQVKSRPVKSGAPASGPNPKTEIEKAKDKINSIKDPEKRKKIIKGIADGFKMSVDEVKKVLGD